MMLTKRLLANGSLNRKRLLMRLIIFILSMYSFLSVIGCQTSSQTKEQRKQADDQEQSKEEKKEADPVPVEVTSVYRGSITAQLKAVSILEPRERASIRSLISGVIQELNVDEGDYVERGELIAKVSRPGANSLLMQASSSYRKAKRDVARIQKLVDRGLAPQEELNQAIFQRDQSAYELSRLRSEAKNEQIRSPISGVVVQRPLYRGETVSPGQVIYEVMDMSEVFAPLHLPDRWAAQVRVGMPAQLFDRDGGLLAAQATVSRVSPIIDAQSGTFKVWVSPPIEELSLAKKKRAKRKKRGKRLKKKGRQALAETALSSPLKPGLFVTAAVTLDEHSHTLLIPNEAVIHRDDATSVMVIRHQQAMRVNVNLGYSDEHRTEVLSPLQEGDQVVTFGQRGLNNGSKVLIITPQDEEGDRTLTPEASAGETPAEALKR